MPVLPGSGPVSVVITERTARIADYTTKLSGLGHLPPGAQPPEPAGPPTFNVLINGVTIPAVVLGYEVGQGHAGPIVVLTIVADHVTVGGKPAAPATPEARGALAWGAEVVSHG